MIVELIGPSGTGKTTAVDQIDGRDCEEPLDIVDKTTLRTLEREAGWYQFREDKDVSDVRKFLPFYLRFPSVALPLLALTILQGRPFRWRYVNRALVTLSFSIHLRDHCRDRIVVLDEGFTQALWALTIDSNELHGTWLIRHVLNAYRRLVDPAGILLKVDPALARARVFSRESKGRFNRQSSPEQQRQFERALEHHRQIVALMPPGMIKATVDSAGDKAEIKQNLIRTIAELTGRQPEANAMSSVA